MESYTPLGIQEFDTAREKRYTSVVRKSHTTLTLHILFIFEIYF